MNVFLFRRILLICAVLFVVVALVEAFGVIPPVKADTYPGVDHKKVVSVFWFNIGLNLVSAFSLFFITFTSKERTWKSASVLFITGFIVMLLGLACADAASAYQKHGPPMQSASILLFICAAVDFLAGVTVTISAFLRPKKV